MKRLISIVALVFAIGCATSVGVKEDVLIAEKNKQVRQDTMTRFVNDNSKRALTQVEIHEIADAMLKSADANSLTDAVIAATTAVESEFDKNAVSPDNCKGLMQLNPKYHKLANYFDPQANAMKGGEELARVIGKYGLTDGLNIYNMGIKNHLAGRYNYKYIGKVTKHIAQYKEKA